MNLILFTIPSTLLAAPLAVLPAPSAALQGVLGAPRQPVAPTAAGPSTAGPAGAGTGGAPAGSYIAVCSPAVGDAALPGACITASSVPALGSLLPLGPELFVAPTGEVGLGTTAPEHALDVVGDLRARSRLALGNDAQIGDPGGFERAFDLSQRITDFSAASDWAGLRSWITLDPPNDLTGLDETFVYGHDLTTRTAPGSGASFEFVQGPWLLASHEGTGHVETLIGANAAAENREGTTAFQAGLAVQSTADSVGQIGWNTCVEIIGGAETPSNSIGSNFGIFMGTPVNVGPIADNYGIYLRDQTVAAGDNFAIYSEGGACYFGGNVGVGTASPTVALEVAGDFAASGTKSFVQAHPADPTKEIWFACLEGNEAGTYFRGSARLHDGRARVPVPADFALVTEPLGLTVQLTALGPGADLWVESIDLGALVVRGARDVELCYVVNGVRSGQAGFRTIRERAARREVSRPPLSEHGLLGAR